MKTVSRVIGIGLAIAFSTSASALAEMVEVDVDPTSPSGGSRAPIVYSGGGKIMVNMVNTDPGPVPLAKVAPPGTLTPAATLTFTGQTQVPSLDGGFIYKPPDTHHAVGLGAGAAGRIVHVTNRGISIFDKTGTPVAAATDLDVFLTALGAAGLTVPGVANLGFDPKVLFDQHSGRFFVVILDGRTPLVRSNIHICTSITSTPSTLTALDWTVETASALTLISGFDTWFDYPGIGADATRLVVTGNLFDAGGVNHGVKLRVFLKSSLTDNGAPAGATFNDINLDGAGATVQPAHVYGASLNTDFYLINRLGSASYAVWQVTGAPPAAMLAGGIPTAGAWVAGALLGTGAPQISDGLNTNPTISLVSPRIQNAVYRGDQIWCALTSDIDGGGTAEVVWFRIDANTGASVVPGVATTHGVLDDGVIDGSTAADWAYMPSIGVNGSGDAVITYSESNSLKPVDMRVAARFVTDAPGTFQAPVVIAVGAGEYDDFGADAIERWGDYSGTTVDPDDDETFWVSHEVCETSTTPAGSDARWGTRIASLGMVVPVTLSKFRIE